MGRFPRTTPFCPSENDSFLPFGRSRFLALFEASAARAAALGVLSGARAALGARKGPSLPDEFHGGIT